MFIEMLFSLALCLVGAHYINSAHAQQTKVTTAEADSLPRSSARISEKMPMAPGPVARTPKLAPTLFPATPLASKVCALEGQTWPPF